MQEKHEKREAEHRSLTCSREINELKVMQESAGGTVEGKRSEDSWRSWHTHHLPRAIHIGFNDFLKALKG
jgi:hypothetical protein